MKWSLEQRTPIRTLDIQDFLQGDSKRKSDFVEKLSECFQEIGFVIIKGHTISEHEQDKVYQVIDSFFSLPTKIKKKYTIPGIGGARGYTGFGVEHAKDYSKGDLKEFFHVGVEVPEDHPLSAVYPKNVSVPDVVDFDSTLRKIYNQLFELGSHVLSAIALSLGLKENDFEEKIKYGNSILRPIHYPPLTGLEEAGSLRSAAHEDINLITLLIGASSPGLQAKTKSGEWVSVTTGPGEIVINVGDMLQRLTNYKLVSTTHRVINPPQEFLGTKRFSVPFFLHPEPQVSLKALPSCVSANNPEREAPITAGDYLKQRLKEIGLL
jgi:isopenicillin N synthase-like dioxygenase